MHARGGDNSEVLGRQPCVALLVRSAPLRKDLSPLLALLLRAIGRFLILALAVCGARGGGLEQSRLHFQKW